MLDIYKKGNSKYEVTITRFNDKKYVVYAVRFFPYIIQKKIYKTRKGAIKYASRLKLEDIKKTNI